MRFFEQYFVEKMKKTQKDDNYFEHFHCDRGMLTTHYKYITAEKKGCSMQVR